MIEVLDWTAKQPNPPPRLVRDGERRFKARRDGKVVERDPKTITGICLHQTACVFGPKGDKAKRDARAFDVPIHAIAFRDGTAIRPYPALWYLYHGNGFNETSLGLEIEGVYCGLVDDPTTAARREDLETAPTSKPDELDALTIETARACVRALVDEGLRLGCPLRYVWAHRQSSPTRRGDPGAAIWKAVALDFAVKELGLVAQPSLALESAKGQGRPIPKDWDPVGGVGRY